MGPESTTRPDAIVHIGTAKTGTTTLQASLQASTSGLRCHGYAYLASEGMMNARELAAVSVGPDGFDDHLNAIGVVAPAERRRFRGEVSERFGRQVDAARRAGVDTVVVSSEHLHSRLVTTAMVNEFRALIQPHVGAVRIVCYLRPQTDLVASFHSTHVRNGGTDTFGETVEKMLRIDSSYVNYDLLLSSWADAFGEDAITVRIFDRTAFEGGSVVADFADVLGLPSGELVQRDDDANQSISHLGQVLIGEINRAAANGYVLTDRASELRNGVAAEFSGKGQRIDPELALTARARFEASNERVRARFRPDLERLFATPPETAKPTGLTNQQESTIGAVMRSLREQPSDEPTPTPDRGRRRFAQAARRFSR